MSRVSASSRAKVQHEQEDRTLHSGLLRCQRSTEILTHHVKLRELVREHEVPGCVQPGGDLDDCLHLSQ